MASFQNVYSELFFFVFFHSFIYLLISVFEVWESEGTKKDRKLGNLSIFGSTSFILQDHNYVIPGNKEVKVLLCVG